jgi:hypothetical protein
MTSRLSPRPRLVRMMGRPPSDRPAAHSYFPVTVLVTGSFLSRSPPSDVSHSLAARSTPPKDRPRASAHRGNRKAPPHPKTARPTPTASNIRDLPVSDFPDLGASALADRALSRCARSSPPRGLATFRATITLRGRRPRFTDALTTDALDPRKPQDRGRRLRNTRRPDLTAYERDEY